MVRNLQPYAQHKRRDQAGNHAGGKDSIMKYWLLTIVSTTKNSGGAFVSNIVTTSSPIEYLQACQKTNARDPDRGEKDRLLFAVQLECASEDEFADLRDNWDFDAGLWL